MRRFTTVWQNVFLSVACAALFYLGALYGVHFTTLDTGIALLWPPNGILIGVLLIVDKSKWGWCLALVPAAEVFADVPVFTVAEALGFAAVNVFEIFVSAWVLKRLFPDFSFGTWQQVTAFLVICMGLTSMIAAFGGALVYTMNRADPDSYWTLWRIWWFGDGVGVLTLTPATVGVAMFLKQLRCKRISHSQLVAGCAGLVLFIAAAQFIFFNNDPELISVFSPILLSPALVVFGLFFGIAHTSISGAILGMLAIYGTVSGLGPYQQLALQNAVVEFQEFQFVSLSLSLLVTSLVESIRKERSDLLMRETVLKSIGEGIVVTDSGRQDMPITYVNSQFEEMTGYSAQEVIGKNCRFLQGDGTERAEVDRLKRSLHSGRGGTFRLLNYRADGSPFWNQLTISPIIESGTTVTGFVGVQRDISELMETQSSLRQLNIDLENQVEERTAQLQEAVTKLERASREDALTGALNRRSFSEVSLSEQERHRRTGQNMTLAIIDIDHFKRVNDRFGHTGGDAALIAFVAMLKRESRSYDYIFRLGGEEFALLMTETNVHEARIVCERIRAACAQMIVDHEHYLIKFTVSIGISPVLPSDTSIDSTLKRADENLYQAKNRGRNQTVFSTVDAEEAERLQKTIGAE